MKLARSPRVAKVHIAPGNAGTALEAELANVPLTEIPDLVAFAREQKIALTVVGPEGPLAAGVVDAFHNAGLVIFGPVKAAAQLESSKNFAKAFMARHGIPTARSRTFSEVAAARAYVDEQGAPIVVKADGLAAVKGVVVAQTVAEAHAAIDGMLSGGLLGTQGHGVVIENSSKAREASSRDGRRPQCAAARVEAEDHRRLRDGDAGPNRAAWGHIHPRRSATPEACTRAHARGDPSDRRRYGGRQDPLQWISLRRRNDRWHPGAPRALEFNCRLGDRNAADHGKDAP